MNIIQLYSKFPKLNCSACFIPTCRSLARRSTLGLSNPSDCPILEWTEGGQKKIAAEEAARQFRGYETETRANIVHTDYVTVHPAARTQEKPMEFLDSDVACKLFSLAGLFDRVQCASRMNALKASRGKSATLFVSDGRILVSGPGPPIDALTPLAMLMWGATIP